MNHSKTGASLSSTTRLSASAKPFTLNRCTQQPSLKFPVHSGLEPALTSPDYCSPDPFDSLLDSFPNFNLGAKGSSVFPSPLSDWGFAHEAAVGTSTATFPVDTASQNIAQEESPSLHPLMDIQGNDDFVVLNKSDHDMFKEFSVPAFCSNFIGRGYDTCNGNELNYGKQGNDYHEGLFGAGNDDGGSATDGSIPRQGKHAVNGLNICKKASDGIFSKGTDSMSVEGSLSNSRGKMQVGAISCPVLTSNCDDAPFIFSTSDMSSAAKLNNFPHSQGHHTSSVVTYSVSVSSGVSDGQYFLEVPSMSNVASDSIGSIPVEIHGSSSACSVLFPFDSSRDMDLLTGSWGTVDDNYCSSSLMSGAKDTFVMLNANGKGTDDGDTEKPKKIGKSVSFDATDYLISTSNDVMLKSNGSSGVVSIKTSSKSLGDSDSDLDSPCWKGKMTSQSPPEISGSVVNTHYFEKELRKCNTLNPLAPQFFPSNAEGGSSLGGKKVKDDFVSSKCSAPLAVNLLPGENRQMTTVTAETHPVELEKGVDLLHSNNTNESIMAFNLVNETKCSFLLNSTCMTQPASIENSSTMKKTIVSAGDVEGCPKETADVMARGSTRGSFPTKCPSPTPSSSSSQAGVVTNLFETLQGVSRSLIDSPKLDVQTMVNSILILSELLVQSCSHGLDSYKQQDHHTIQHIINNLNVFSAIYSGQLISAVQSTHTGSPDFLGESSELPKHLRKGVEEASIETSAIPKKLHKQNDNGGQSVSKAIAERGQYSVSSSRVSAEKGNEIVQVIRRNLGRSLDAEEHLHPQVVLYKNLWLDAEAAMCHMRRKIYLRLMETGMDVNQTDLVDLWR